MVFINQISKLRWGLAILLSLAASVGYSQSRDRLRGERLQMVEDYLEKEGISNPRVLTVMRYVPRHEFVSSQSKKYAYEDMALSIGYKQTISPPFIVAYMTQMIDPQPSEKVLEVGTGSGYQAAVLSGLAKEVYTIEIVEPLGRQAAKRLESLGYKNVFPKVGDGYQGWKEHAPFDKIIVTCSPEKVPQPLIDQLKEGGKMIIPLGQRYQQVFYLFEKRDGKLKQTQLIPTLFVPMTGTSEIQRRIKPDPLNPKVVNGGFELDNNSDGRADSWHYQRQTELVAENAPSGKAYIKFKNQFPGRMSQALQGMALDGRKVDAVKIIVSYQMRGVAPGHEKHHQPGVMIHFYDSVRRTIGEELIGPMTGTQSWAKTVRKISVPKNTREAIIRIGLNGGTGELSLDDIRLEKVGR
jgi:protein-L-isoaspartate(D-aspartate) O-methyltransferase